MRMENGRSCSCHFYDALGGICNAESCIGRATLSDIFTCTYVCKAMNDFGAVRKVD